MQTRRCTGRCAATRQSGVELCADGLGDALLDKAEQFGFDVVAGELERELLGALTATRPREDLVDGVPKASGIAWLVCRSMPAPDHWT
jgi:hypothetical protein